MRVEHWHVLFASLTVVAAQKCVPVRRQALTVTSAATAAELTKAVKCSEGVFDVSWQGAVQPLTTIIIGTGTTLRIKGSSSSGSSVKSAGASINGQSKLQLFAVSKQAVLELSDLTLSGGRLMASSSAQGGAAVFVDEGSILNASRVTFTGHDSSSDSSSSPGGAVFAAKGSQLALQQCTFTNNTCSASKGGAVYQQSGVVVVQYCTFTANSGSSGGALCSAAGIVNITDSYFSSNVALAAAFGTNGSPGFNDGSAQGASPDDTVADSGSQGGALYLGINATSVITGCTFSDNIARISGGAVFSNEGELSFERCEFVRNAADSDAGAVYSTLGSVSMKECSLLNNSAAQFGGALYTSRGTLAVDNSTCSGNTAGVHGGAIYQADALDAHDSVCSVNGSQFLNNSASDGGAIYQDNGALALSNSVFSSNTALRSAGGAIFSSQLSSLTVAAAEFTQNAAAVDGGAISIEGNSSITDTHFSNNTAAQHGGAVIVRSAGAVTLTTCVFSGNSAVYGGSLQAAAVPGNTDVQPLTVSGCTFNGNTGTYGGAAHVIRSAVTVSDSTFEHNVASNLGGAICVEGVGSIAISSTTFDANTASTGGAVNCQQQAAASISTSVFTANTGVDGGAISIQCKATISDTLFNSNVAKASGGALSYISIQLSGIASTIDGCTMHNNSAAEGGAIAVQQNVTLTISSSTITNNSAQLSAGGISQQSGYTILPVLQQGTIVLNNTAGCCYAAGYGINATTINNSADNSTNSCADIDSGTDRQCCLIGEYSNDIACIRCPDGYACTTLGLTVTTLPVMPGRWRENITQNTTRQCWNEKACSGGVANDSSGTDSYCAAGYKGPCK
jgi:predicted outer membrane repeat protein